MSNQREISLSDVLHAFGVPDQVTAPAATGSALDVQEGGDHYKKLGQYQPWEVAFAQLSPEEFKGAMKITVMSYLAREADKGGSQDIRKAAHTLQIYLELEARRTAQQQPDADDCQGCAHASCGGCQAGEVPDATLTPPPAFLRYDPVSGKELPPHFAPFTADEYRAYHGPVAWLFNPYTGERRDLRDVGSDVLGHLITPQ